MEVNTDIDDADLIKAAQEALTRLSHFAYYGDLPLFESWGITFTQYRDSDALVRSNYRVAMDELRGRAVHEDGDNAEDASEYVDDIRCSHWAYGWAEHIVVKVLEDEEAGITLDNITHTFRAAAALALFLRDEYLVLSDSDFSELEYEEAMDYFDQEWRAMLRYWDEDTDGPEPTDQDKERLLDGLTEQHGYSVDDWSGNFADMVKADRADH